MSPMSTDPDHYLKKAKNIVVKHYNQLPGNTGQLLLTTDEVYIVWFAKVLGNWKALVSTDRASGLYYEVTYNGAKQETYLDEYHKHLNYVFSD